MISKSKSHRGYRLQAKKGLVMVHAGKLFSAEGGFPNNSIRAGNLKNPKRTSSEVRRGGEKGEEGREKGKGANVSILECLNVSSGAGGVGGPRRIARWVGRRAFDW